MPLSSKSSPTPNALSAVAGIVDRQGGFRVIIDADMDERCLRRRRLVLERERLFVVPDLRVPEPVPWAQIPAVVDAAREHTLKCLAPVNHCGSCRQCCFTLYVAELNKPSQTWCNQCTATGCGTYWKRPQACRRFECMWLKSQKRNDRMGEDLRPDRCGVIFTDDSAGDRELFEVHPDKMRPGCVDAPTVRGFIDDMQHAGYKAKLITHYFGEGSDDAGPPSQRDQ